MTGPERRRLTLYFAVMLPLCAVVSLVPVILPLRPQSGSGIWLYIGLLVALFGWSGWNAVIEIRSGRRLRRLVKESDGCVCSECEQPATGLALPCPCPECGTPLGDRVELERWWRGHRTRATRWFRGRWPL